MPHFPLDPPVLVVVEREAACTLWMAHWGDEPESWSVAEQEVGESSVAFAERLHAILDRFSAFGGVRARIVFVLGPGMSTPAMNQRWSRATDFMQHLARFDGAELVLTTGYCREDGEQPALALLATELQEECPPSVAVSIRNRDSVRRSGVRVRRDGRCPEVAANDLVA